MTKGRYVEIRLTVDGRNFVVRVAPETKPDVVTGVMNGFRDWLLADPARAERIANGVAEGV
jgi:hypothetical protein